MPIHETKYFETKLGFIVVSVAAVVGIILTVLKYML